MADNNLFNMVDRTSEFDQNDAQQNKVMGILAYLGFLVLVPIFAAKESKFARFHANQGLVLFIIELASGVISSILGWIPIVGIIVTIAVSLIGLCTLVLSILGIINAVNGQAKELPLIGSIKILK